MSYMGGACDVDLPVQALKARGEPLLSSFECTPPGIQEYFQPLHWKLTELLSPK